MHRGARAIVLVALVTLAAPAASACFAGSASVPCGYVYPRLLFDLGERGTTYTLTSQAPVLLEGSLTFTWDITAEGMALQNPTIPIVVSFDFPRKPDWLDVSVDPPELEIPISPQYLQPSQTAAGPQLVYSYTAPIAVTARLTATPTVDPELPPSLRILAQSTESGLYKPGFGVRDLPLALPEAIVQAAQRDPAAELRVGTPEPLALEPLALEFEGATLALEAEGPVELWKPAALVARVARGGAPVRGVDLAATIVDEGSQVLYTTGLRQRPDGAMPFTYTFPAPGHYRVLVMARPLAGISEATFDPLVADFPLVLPGVGFDALRYPDAYRAAYVEPVSEVHANTADLPRQFEKTIPFPVLAGADSAAIQVRLGTDQGAALGVGSFYAEVLSPAEEQLAFGKLDPVTPGLDARLRAPLRPGTYKVHLYGTGANPLGLAGTTLAVDVGVFYPEEPVGTVIARGAPRPLVGGPIPLLTGGVEADLVLHEEPALWAPLHATVVAKDAAGRTALHPDFILTVRGPPGSGYAGEDGSILYTTGLRHPHDGLLHWGFAPPMPGLYTISAYAAPTAEVSGAFWQPAIASWVVPVGGTAYPAEYRAEYHDTTSTIRTDGYGGGASFDKRYPLPVLAGARELTVDLALMTSAMVDHVEGAGPAALGVEVLDPDGTVLASMAPTSSAGALAFTGFEGPGTYLVRVFGTAYAPVDYGGAMYNLTVALAYDEAPPLEGAEAPPSGEAPRPVPGFEPLLAVGVLAVLGVLGAARARRR